MELQIMGISKEDMKKMQGSICPTCNMPMFKKSGKRTHSLSKSAVCEAKFREKCAVSHEDQYVTVEGKRYLIDANFKKKSKK